MVQTLQTNPAERAGECYAYDAVNREVYHAQYADIEVPAAELTTASGYMAAITAATSSTAPYRFNNFPSASSPTLTALARVAFRPAPTFGGLPDSFRSPSILPALAVKSDRRVTNIAQISALDMLAVAKDPEVARKAHARILGAATSANASQTNILILHNLSAINKSGITKARIGHVREALESLPTGNFKIAEFGGEVLKLGQMPARQAQTA